MDYTRHLSSQVLCRPPTPNNPLGLYYYESFSDVVSWGLVGWPSTISGNINFNKTHDTCILTINIITNNNSSATIPLAEINGGGYRIPKRFRPKNADGLTFYALITVAEGSIPKLGSLEIYNNTGNDNDPLNGRIRFGAVNPTGNGFTNANARVLTSSITYQCSSIFNE